MKKRFFVSIMLACALTATFALSACNEGQNTSDGDDKTGPSVTDVSDELRDALAQLISDGNVTSEIQIFVANYKQFTLNDGKYTCAELASVNGATCKNIEIALEDGKVSKVTYELRTASKDTPDRLVTIDKDGVSMVDIPDDTQMNEDEWKEQATVFADVTNYTLERVRVSSGDYIASMKLDGSTYYEEVSGSETILDIENGKYYCYSRDSQTDKWEKDEVTVGRYNSYVGTPSLMVTLAAQAVQNNFSKFAFNAGVYTAEELTVEYSSNEFTLRDMEVTVIGGKIVRAVCVLVDGYSGRGDERITVDYVGSTSIELPKEYTDNTVTPPPTSSDDKPTDDKPTDDKPTGDTTVMNADTWKKQFSATSFTVIFGMSGMNTTYLVDGDNLEQRESMGQGVETIRRWILEDGVYQNYEYGGIYGKKWVKLEAGSHSAGTEDAVSSYHMMFSLFADEFSSFTLKDGKYTCAELKKTVTDPSGTAEQTFTDVEIVFNEKNELISIKFNMAATANLTISYEITAIGTTSVKAPDDFIQAGQ